MKLCVIGAGAAGLCAAKNGIDFGCDVTVFEQTDKVGGTWVYTDEVGKDKNGLKVHSSMYQGLYTNLPKEIMGFPDFPIPSQENSYISSNEFLSYLELYAKQFNLREIIKFQHHVTKVENLADLWEVTVRKFPGDENKTFSFDAVLVCNGHYNAPLLPEFEGRNIFRGEQIHSHDYRKHENFAGEQVLVIGAGPSGIDLANEISKVSESVTLSHRLKEPIKTKFLPNVDQRPDVVKLTKNGAKFTDGSQQRFTVIFYCTGYKYVFPFLSIDCRIACDNNYVRPLYKHCLSINQPSLGFIGLPFYVCASQMFDLQSKFCLTFMTKRKPIPPKEKIILDTENEMDQRWKKGLGIHQAHLMGQEQNDYYSDLASVADLKPLQRVISKLHNFSSSRFLDDLTNFRKDIFRLLDDETFVKVAYKNLSFKQ